MTATDAQVRIAMRERQAGKTQEQAAAKANLRSRKTVAKYERAGAMSSSLARPREYSTRADPFRDHWTVVEERLYAAPELEAKALFEWLCEENPGRYQEGQLRTFQRRVRRWRAQNTEKVLSLPQLRVPGELMETDCTCMNQLGVTIGGQPFPHMLVHTVLPYSNWEWGRVVQSESLMAIWTGLRSAIEELGYIPEAHQTDNSGAATHRLGRAERDKLERGTPDRGFNDAYLDLLDPLGIAARKTHVRAPDENGDVEALHGAACRAINQHLLLRGSRDFDSVAAYEEFLFAIFRKRNLARSERLAQETAVMRPLRALLPPPVREFRPRVSRSGTTRVLNFTYSLPSGYSGEVVIARVSEWEVEFWHGTRRVQVSPRRTGRHFDVNYRHVIDSLLRKPGGFRNYRYRDALFPTTVFRQAWDSLCARLSPRKADLAYLRILKYAADTLESEVAVVLAGLLADAEHWDDETVRSRLRLEPARIPDVGRGDVDLRAYDALLAAGSSS